MNPNHQLKDKLQYELSVRGISRDSDVQTLHKLFRSVLAEKFPVDLCNLSTPSVQGLLDCVVNKTLQLQALITQQKSQLDLFTPHFQTRISQLRGRLRHLMEFDPSASGITTSKYQQVRDRLDSIAINLAKMDMADRPGQEKEEGDDTSNTTQEEVSAQDNFYIGPKSFLPPNTVGQGFEILDCVLYCLESVPVYPWAFWVGDRLPSVVTST